MESRVDIKKRSYKEVSLISIAHGFTHWYPATFYLLLPLIGKEFGLSYSEIGFILTFFSIVSSLSSLPGGMFVDIVKRKGLLMAFSLFWVGIPYFIMGFSQHYVTLLLCMALVGVGNTLWHPTAIPTLSQLYPERKGLMLSLHNMGSSIGDAVAPLAIGILLLYWDWRSVMIINVVPGLLMAAVILYFLRHLYIAEKKERKEGAGKADAEKQSGAERLRAYLSDTKRLLKNKNVLLLSTSSSFRTMTQKTIYIFLPLYLLNELGHTTYFVGVCLFILQASGFIAGPVAGYLSDKVGRKNIIMSSMVMTAAVILLMIVLPKTLFVFFIALLGFFLYAMRPVIQAWLMDETESSVAGTSVSVLFGMQSIGSAIAPLAAGLIADAYGILSTFYFVAGTIIVANLLVFFIPQRVGAKAPPSISA